MKYLSFLIIFFFTQNLFAQAKGLNDKIFKSEILNSNWTNKNENSPTIIVFSINVDSVGITYMDWAEGFISCKWAYKTYIKNNIFILTLNNPNYANATAFLYGYLKDDGALIINLQEEKLKDEKEFLNDKSNSWTLFKFTD